MLILQTLKSIHTKLNTLFCYHGVEIAKNKSHEELGRKVLLYQQIPHSLAHVYLLFLLLGQPLN